MTSGIRFGDSPSRRYGSDLPKLEVFVCTADPVIEPPLMVVNTVVPCWLSITHRSNSRCISAHVLCSRGSRICSKKINY
ncbi:hypothetical protein Bca52824_081018 [Brassica carinata]|uniref:Uncharacterized protein n=1 Tax=Brassica carinata TaxID=52824 RepID=A0A8X7PH67_BRACI|nr:hypothetical protein Bca52824_081018 [Brassica carinata]